MYKAASEALTRNGLLIIALYKPPRVILLLLIDLFKLLSLYLLSFLYHHCTIHSSTDNLCIFTLLEISEIFIWSSALGWVREWK